MLKRIVMQLSGKMGCLFTQALAWLKVQVCRLVSNLRVKFTQTYLNVTNRLRQLANIARLQNSVLAVKMKLALLLTSASKIVLTRLELLWIQVGLKYHGNVIQRLRPALLLQKLNKKLAELIKLVQLAIKKAVAVLTRMVTRLKVIGMKSQETVNQRQQPAQRQRLKEHLRAKTDTMDK